MLYNHKTTAGVSEVTMEILDTASQFPEEELVKHIKWGDGFILMYSVTDKRSFLEAVKLKDLLYKYRFNEIPVVLVANKCDLLTARTVTDDDGLSLAADMDCQKFEISVADELQGVMEAMHELCLLMKREHVKSLTNTDIPNLEKRSKLFNMKNAIKKRITRSRSDTY